MKLFLLAVAFGGSRLWFADGDGFADVADLEAGEAADGDVLAELADYAGDELLDGDRLFLDERLLVQADFLVKLRHLAFEHLLDDVGGLAGCCSLGAIDLLLLFVRFRSYVLLADVLGIDR